MQDKVCFTDKLSTQNNKTIMSKTPLASDVKTEKISGSDKPKRASKKKKSDSFDIIAIKNNSNKEEEEEEGEEEEDISGTVVVTTTTTRKSPIKDTAEVVASADDTAENATELYIDTVDYVLRDHEGAYDSDHQKKGKKKVQGVPQSQTAALPRLQEEEETDKSKQAQIEQTYEKH